MFVEANRKAGKFTFPVVISRKTVAGKCFGSIASFIVINRDGWIATCQHVATEIENGMQSEIRARDLEAQRDAIRADQTLSNTQQRKKIVALGALKSTHVDRIAVTWGVELSVKLQVPMFYGAPVVDLVVGKLDQFDPAWVSEYPVFKDPEKDFEPGASLCKLGHPFHSITPTWNGPQNTFELPQDAFPVPRFPIEGILTRLVNVAAPQIPGPPPFPMQYFETSTPGLQGQSGGPIFDKNGTVWGIQSHTAHYPLGFNPPVPNSTKGEKEHQFLNVGRCIHASSIIGLLRSQGIQHQVSTYC